MKRALFVATLFLLCATRVGAQVNPCLAYFDSIPGYQKGNMDSVLVDTCRSTEYHTILFAKRWFEVVFTYNVLPIPPVRADSIVEVTWQAIDTNYSSLRTAFGNLESVYGPYVLRKDNPSWADTSDVLNNMFRIRFYSYVDADKVDSSLRSLTDNFPVESAGFSPRLLLPFLAVDLSIPSDARLNIFPNSAIVRRGEESELTISLEHPTLLRVQLVDPAGRILRTIAEGQQAPGDAKVFFSADASLATGLYFIVWKTGSGTFAKKILVE